MPLHTFLPSPAEVLPLLLSVCAVAVEPTPGATMTAAMTLRLVTAADVTFSLSLNGGVGARVGRRVRRSLGDKVAV